jgi:hypothetical protein
MEDDVIAVLESQIIALATENEELRRQRDEAIFRLTARRLALKDCPECGHHPSCCVCEKS